MSVDDYKPAHAARELARLIDRARRIVVFTGAGVSTDCGIPDFRSPGGQWANAMPIPFQDFVADPEARREAWRRKFAMQPYFDTATNQTVHRSGAHTAIRRLFDTGRVTAVVTQNIDNLHQASGIPHDSVIELHGNGSFATCLDCGARHELDAIFETFQATGDAPPCGACGGILKTATVSFGQAMPEQEVLRAHEHALGCDLFLALGSSLVVYPAANVPVVAKQGGATLVIVNREPTPLDEIADMIIQDDISAAFAPWIGE